MKETLIFFVFSFFSLLTFSQDNVTSLKFEFAHAPETNPNHYISISIYSRPDSVYVMAISSKKTKRYKKRKCQEETDAVKYLSQSEFDELITMASKISSSKKNKSDESNVDYIFTHPWSVTMTVFENAESVRVYTEFCPNLASEERGLELTLALCKQVLSRAEIKHKIFFR